MLYLNDTATRAEMSLTTKILTLKVSHMVPDSLVQSTTILIKKDRIIMSSLAPNSLCVPCKEGVSKATLF